MNKIIVNHTSIIINDYNLGDNEKLEKRLSIWDGVRHKYIPIAFMYNENTKQLFIPRGIDITYIEKIFNAPAEIRYEPDPYDNVSIKVKTMPKNDIQRKSISFLIGEEDFKYTKKYSQLLLNLPTGEGKTYVTSASLQFLSTKAIIITPIDKIKKQWYDTFVNMTDIQDGYICDISGSNVIKNLMKQKTLKYKIYLVNHGTIIAYAKSNGWAAVHEFFKHIKVGVKIYDEAHLNFENILRIDLNTNTKKTIYLTATFERSDYKENSLFNTCFKNVIRYGYEVRQEIRRHIMYLAILYDSHPDLAEQAYMSTYRGFNKIRYAEYESNSDAFYEALAYAVKYFKNMDGKMLILSSTIDLVDKITDFLNKSFDDLSVSSYHSKLTEDEKDKALQSDIISTTPKSAGTGVDIKKLRTVIMCEAYSSTVQADQVSGRLREYSDNDSTFYVELVDTGFKKVYNMYRGRLSVFKKKCSKLLSINLTGEE